MIKLILRFFALCLMPLVVASQVVNPGAPQAGGPAHKRILILYPFNNNFPTLHQMAAGIDKVVASHSLRSSDFLHEYLDIAPSRYPAQRSELGQLLSKKYAAQRFDLIVTYGDIATQFLLNEGKALSPGSPCVVIFGDRSKYMEQAERQIAHAAVQSNPRDSLELGLKLFPKTRKVLFVAGNSANDLKTENQARTEFARWQGKLEFEYTSNRSVDELTRYVAQLPPNTLIIFSNISSDITGKSFVPRDVVKVLVGKSNAPVLSIFSTQIDTGVLGGAMIDMELVGAMIGSFMLALESGKAIETMVPTNYIKPMFNWTQIERWGVDTDRLPADSVFINRPLTLWGQYKAEVLWATLLILALSAMAVALSLQNRRRKLAELSALDSAVQLSAQRDLLEQRVVERTARLSEALEFSETMLLNSPLPMGIYAESGQCLMANEALAKFVGATRQAVLAQNFKEIGAWQSTSLLDDCLAALKFNTCHQREARAVSSFGKEQWFEYRILPRHLKGQNHLLIQFFDLTERKHAEKALRASEAHFRMLAEGMVDVVWKADRAMRFTYINDADFHLRGFSREEVVGHPIADTLMPEGQAILSEVMAERRELEARGDRDHDLHFIVPQRCKDGRVIWADVLSIPIYDSDGQIEGYQGIGRDVTERIRCEESRVSQARKEEQSRLGQQIAHLDRQRALGELAASLGHELNQPLAAILTNVQVVKRGLKRGRMDDAQLTEFLDKIAQSTKRASQIIERIRNYIRPSRTDHEPVNLNAVVAEVIKLMADDARSRKVSVVPPATAAPVMVTGDAIQLSQIVLNVMRNAFDSVAQVARREVYVSCSQANDRAIVRVRDTGTGLAPETLIEVGKAFFTTKSSGLGMGFSISRSIAQQHGGSLTLSNADSSEGSGAIVELNLPALSPTNP